MTVPVLVHCSEVTLQTGGCWPAGQPTVQYNEWSGFLSIFLPPLITLLGVVLLWCWHNQCARHHCYWPTTRRTAAGERACWLHHPDPHRTTADIHAAHHEAVRARRTSSA